MPIAHVDVTLSNGLTFVSSSDFSYHRRESSEKQAELCIGVREGSAQHMGIAGHCPL